MNINPFLLDLYHQASQTDAASLGTQALNDLQGLLPFEAGALYSVSMFEQQALRFNACLSYGHALEKLRYRFEHVANERLNAQQEVCSPDRLLHRATRQPGHTFAQDVSGIASPGIRAYARQFETAHALLHTQRQGQHYQMLSLWRADKRQAFAQEELYRADLLLPHVFNAMALADQFQARATLPGATSQAELVVDRQGHIVIASLQALDWLSQEWTQCNDARLPAPLTQALFDSPQRRFQGRQINAELRPGGALWRVRLQRRDNPQQLTLAEQRVARLAAGGLSYKEAARELGISPATVRNQLHSIYGKLNISGKAALGHVLQAA
ncbi:helix-turn-helix transcriptional regulator [Curvibacter gracilis]|uniref:helix-turn-helix transcriptional regulator n=1 Tax=Curvibacter gracilis TaxID=230310 RepID=UPI00047F8761|nr:helix-turn-helix transcriptional regulator [Curvibacter gracilis]